MNKLFLIPIVLLAAITTSAQVTIKGAVTVKGPVTVAAPAASSIAYVNDCGNGNNGSSGTVSTTVTIGGGQCFNASTVSAGNILVAAGFSPSAATTLATPTGTCVSSWTAVSNGTGSSLNLYTWIGTETTTGACTVIFSGTVTSTTNVSGQVMILSGAAATIRNSAYGNGGFCTSCSLPTINANNGDMIVGMIFDCPPTATAQSPYTLGFVANTAGDTVGLVYNVASSTGSIPSPAYTSGGSSNPPAVSLAIEP